MLRARSVAATLVLLLYAGCGGGGDGGTTGPSTPPTPVATSVRLSPTSLSFDALGATRQISATVLDQNGATMSGQSVSWSSADGAVATVSSAGTVTSVSNGSTTVTATTGSVSATATVTVAQSAGSITLSETDVTLTSLGETRTVGATVTDSNGTPVSGATVQFGSSDASVVTVGSDGTLTAVANGTATVTATSGSISASVTVTVQQQAATVTVDPGTLAFSYTGEARRVSARAWDAGGTEIASPTVTWSSANAAIATVSGTGVVQAVSDGTTNIVATVGAATGTAPAQVAITMAGHGSNVRSVPLGGNAWVENGDGLEIVATDGVQGWTSTSATVRTYFRVMQAGELRVSATIADDAGSEVTLTIGGDSRLIPVAGGGETEYFAGAFQIAAPGYVAVDLQGLMRTGQTFGRPVTIRVSGSAVTADLAFVPNNDGNMFYFGRRGPSVHLNWVPPAINVEWMYSEVTVPAGEDVIATFFQANGHSTGYFGMQVNSATERQFIFSIWSPFDTDDPSTIPEDKRVRATRVGDGVVIGEFGNEGSGGQSRLPFMWQAGNTYRFLTRIHPNGDGTTSYTSWVYAPEIGAWRLIATFLRPDTNAYASGMYSFLENFDPEQGDITRKGFYERQWVGDENGQWFEVTDLSFTTDNTGGQGFRLDYDGGLDGSRPFLRMGGFFDDNAVPNTFFTRPASSGPPTVDLSILP